MQLLSINPLLGYVSSFVSKSEISNIEAALEGVKLNRAMVGSSEGPVVDEIRTALNYKIRHGSIKEVDRLTAKIAELFRLKSVRCEYPELIHYEIGQEFKRHFDALLSGPTTAAAMDEASRSQRIFTAILYLNDDFVGGTTDFPRLGIELTPVRGTLVFWQNTKPGSADVHHLSIHEGKPVLQGSKRIISFWFRDRPWVPQYSE